MKYINNSKLLDCKFSNGMPMLPYYHCGLISKMNNISYASEMTTLLPLWKRIKNLMKSWKKIGVKRKSILIFSSTLFNVKNDNGIFNYMHSYYNIYKNDTLLIEDGDLNFGWRTFDSVPCLSTVNSTMVFVASLFATLLNKIRPLHREDFIPFETDFSQHVLDSQLSRDDYFVKIYSFLLNILFDRVNPKCIILNCASYGHNMSVITYNAKKRGINVIEPQHGVIRKGPAYSASEIIVNSSEFNKCMPDVLFTFGEKWIQGVDWKYEKYVVGSPYLNEYAEKKRDFVPDYDYLIISQPMSGENERNKVNFVKRLACIFPDKRILFRIHPSENFSEQVNKYQGLDNISVSNSTSVLYDDITNSVYIVGWWSNCLYEALAFGKNPIIVDTSQTREYMEQGVGIWIKDPSEITASILQKQNNIDFRQYWADNFEERVKMYLDSILK